MAPRTDEEVDTLFDRAHVAVRRSREIRAVLPPHGTRSRHSRAAERRVIAEHRAALRELNRNA